MTNVVPHEDDMQQILVPSSEFSLYQASERVIINASHFPTSTSPKKRRQKKRVQFQEEEVAALGSYCSVRKHSRLGCAVVTFESESLRDAVLLYFQHNYEEEVAAWQRSDIEVNVQQHVDKSTNDFGGTGLFVTWGRELEKMSPIPVQFLRERFDLAASRILLPSWKCCAPPPDEIPRSRFFQE
eukprot:TRINITY_DN7477_c0_g5_i1.p1 TRINITY_DN7477_c0_g5~~TRINITY_DN7477_c0_g5_i1.p1  ORF type:complete len:184 (-),score=28.04 TRINITY_DN7477_c0_g5_i1:269-820(-)